MLYCTAVCSVQCAVCSVHWIIISTSFNNWKARCISFECVIIIYHHFQRLSMALMWIIIIMKYMKLHERYLRCIRCWICTMHIVNFVQNQHNWAQNHTIAIIIINKMNAHRRVESGKESIQQDCFNESKLKSVLFSIFVSLFNVT